MAFDFLSKFTKGDLEKLRSFLQGQLDNVDMQINHMTVESDRLQKTLNKLSDYANSRGVAFRIFGKNFNRKHENAFDAIDVSSIVQQTKEPYYRNIKNLERIEFKMKKLMDKIEQTQEQIYLLRMSKSEFRVNIDQINSLFDASNPQLTVEPTVTAI
jgi:flagellar biosynthesis chaperone FliJ